MKFSFAAVVNESRILDALTPMVNGGNANIFLLYIVQNQQVIALSRYAIEKMNILCCK